MMTLSSDITLLLLRCSDGFNFNTFAYRLFIICFVNVLQIGKVVLYYFCIFLYVTIRIICICCRFVKCWNRGENSCSRCDFEYLPVPNSRHTYKRENESVKSESNAKLSMSGSCKPYDAKQMDIKKEEKVQLLPMHPCCQLYIYSA